MAEFGTALADIETLSEAISAAAEARAWDDVIALDEARYALLAALPASVLQSGDEAVKRVLEQALAVTRAVLADAREQQSREADSLRHVQRGHRGARAYLNAGG